MTELELIHLKEIATAWMKDAPDDPALLINEVRMAYLSLKAIEQLKDSARSQEEAIERGWLPPTKAARLMEALQEIIKYAPTEMPEDWRDSGNYDDAYTSGCYQEHFRLAEIARAALQ